LIDELKSDDVSARLTSIHRLTTIALALGPQRTRDELIPFITEGMDDEEFVNLHIRKTTTRTLLTCFSSSVM
jgi:serine/threonine-protein phosphatase 2A regulatory subunit A